MGLPEEDHGMIGRFIRTPWFYLALALPNVPFTIANALRGQVWWACFAAGSFGLLLGLAYATWLDRHFSLDPSPCEVCGTLVTRAKTYGVCVNCAASAGAVRDTGFVSVGQRVSTGIRGWHRPKAPDA